MSKTMIEIAKAKDDGSFAKMGMRDYIATWFNIDYNSPCLLEIVDTYLECIDNISFDKYVYGLYLGGRPFIITRQDLETSYKDLLHVSDDLEVVQKEQSEKKEKKSKKAEKKVLEEAIEKLDDITETTMEETKEED